MLASLLAAGACKHAPGEAETTNSEIQDGKPISRLDVVLLIDADEKPTCTGTLISKTIVLTASHCIGDGISSAYVGYSYAVGRDERIDVVDAARVGAQQFKLIESLRMMPSSVVVRLPDGGTYVQKRDVALLRLDRPVEGVALSELAAVRPPIGEECLAVGYGAHEATPGVTTFGEQRSARVRVEAFDNEWTLRAKRIDGIPDGGDSGGPLHCGGRIVGVLSKRHRSEGEPQAVFASVTAGDVAAFVAETRARWER